jgi:hypothetical protein
MNYIAEINAFRVIAKKIKLSINDACLWYALMGLANDNFWTDNFKVKMSVLKSETRLSKNSILRARNSLKEKCLIIFNESKNDSTTYTMIPLASNDPVTHINTPSHTGTPPSHTGTPPVPHRHPPSGEKTHILEPQTYETKQLTEKQNCGHNNCFFLKQENINKHNKPYTREKFFDDETLNSIFFDFLEQRQKKDKTCNTQRAIALLVAKIKQYDPKKALELIEKSIINNWKGIFDDEKKTSTQQTKTDQQKNNQEKVYNKDAWKKNPR